VGIGGNPLSGLDISGRAFAILFHSETHAGTRLQATAPITSLTLDQCGLYNGIRMAACMEKRRRLAFDESPPGNGWCGSTLHAAKL